MAYFGPESLAWFVRNIQEFSENLLHGEIYSENYRKNNCSYRKIKVGNAVYAVRYRKNCAGYRKKRMY